MSKFLQVVAGFTCLAGLVLGAITLDYHGSLLSSFRGWPETKTSLGQENGIQREERLHQMEDTIRRRKEAKLHIAEEVIARRLSLAEAMEKFHSLDEEWPRIGPVSQWTEPMGISEDEWDGRGVLLYVQWVLNDRPNETATIVGCLEKELQEILADRKKRPAAPAEKPMEPSR